MEIGAYWYPQTAQCEQRFRRAQALGMSVPNESELVQSAEPMFAGHEQPKTYSIDLDSHTIWDDSYMRAVKKQAALAVANGIEFMVVDTYSGLRDGIGVVENEEAVENIVITHGLKVAPLVVLGGARAQIPVPLVPDRDFIEPNRAFDATIESVEYSVDYCAGTFWSKANAFRLDDGRPYISTFGDGQFARSSFAEQVEYHNMVAEVFRDLARSVYGEDPYIVRLEKSAKRLIDFGIQSQGYDALSGYALLPDFNLAREQPVQDYRSLMNKRSLEWKKVAASQDLPFVPPAVVGWDSSPRGEQGYTLDQASGRYPFTPVVTGGDAHDFEQMLRLSVLHTEDNVPDNQQYSIIAAWNEVGEGAALLPTIDGSSVDSSCLDAVRNVSEVESGQKEQGQVRSNNEVRLFDMEQQVAV